MTPLSRMLVLLLTLFFIILAAGCAAGDCPVKKTTRMVSKISHNGTLLWTQSFDTGIQNMISDITPLPDGGIVTAGSLSTKRQNCIQEYKARVIRLSDSGIIIWDRFFDASGIGKATTITSTDDGGFVTVFNTGEIYKFDNDGNKVWSRHIGYSWDYWSAIETGDGEIVIAGPVFLKLDRNGTVLWQRSYPNSSPTEKSPVIVLENSRGFILEYFTRDTIVWNNFTILVFQTDFEGNFINSTFIQEKNLYLQPIFSEAPEGYLIFLSSEEFSGGKTGILRFNSDGAYINRQTINASVPIILTKDNGYLYAEIVNQSVQVVKMNQNETLEWDSTIPVRDPRFGAFIDKIIKTSDGGYVIIYGTWDQVDLR